MYSRKSFYLKKTGYPLEQTVIRNYLIQLYALFGHSGFWVLQTEDSEFCFHQVGGILLHRWHIKSDNSEVGSVEGGWDGICEKSGQSLKVIKSTVLKQQQQQQCTAWASSKKQQGKYLNNNIPSSSWFNGINNLIRKKINRRFWLQEQKINRD